MAEQLQCDRCLHLSVPGDMVAPRRFRDRWGNTWDLVECEDQTRCDERVHAQLAGVERWPKWQGPNRQPAGEASNG